MTTFEPVKGFRDFTGEDALKRAQIRKILVETFEKYGFQPAETPIIEQAEFVKGENSNDEAVSDIFKLQDRGKRDLALRYEFTFQIKRLMNNKKLPYKRYQIGEVFRDEPVSANRFRQFVQCDIDTIGSTVKDEAEVLAAASEILERLGLKFVIYVNNRKLLNEILEKEGVEPRNTEKVMKVIDKLDKLPEEEVYNELMLYNAKNILELFKKPEKFFEKYENYKEIKQLKEFCELYNVEIKFQPSLARGLSYYNGTVFEVKTKELKETITAGGSYMFNSVQCTGISLGLDRLSGITKIDSETESYLIVSLEQDKKAIELAQKLRNSGKVVTILYGKPSKALEYANSYSINKVIFVGSEEVKSKQFKVKDMKTGKESLFKI
ncbi:Histidine--tRNA ligase [uncultured archaeon]|nr:Histidine--tRNA ligase [uncultured archaeon]